MLRMSKFWAESGALQLLAVFRFHLQEILRFWSIALGHIVIDVQYHYFHPFCESLLTLPNEILGQVVSCLDS